MKLSTALMSVEMTSVVAGCILGAGDYGLLMVFLGSIRYMAVWKIVVGIGAGVGLCSGLIVGKIMVRGAVMLAVSLI